MNTNAKFDCGLYYHVYGKTNNKERLFRSQDNRNFFLQRLKHYLGGFLDIHAYALMGNHYHLSVKIKDEVKIQDYLGSVPVSERTLKERDYLVSQEKSALISDLVSSEFRRFFISYSQAFNKRYNRKGNLFNKPFKKSLYDPEKKFVFLQYYIHHNARKHGLVSDFEEYKHHSYFEILDNNSSLIDIQEIISRFGSIENFELFHKEIHYEDMFEGLIIED